MPFSIVRNDITKMKVHAIVNAANTELKIGGGVCGAVFNAAGKRKLQDACEKLAPIKTGEAVATPAFALPAKYIIHTACPIYKDGKSGEEELLRSAYTNSLNWLWKRSARAMPSRFSRAAPTDTPRKNPFTLRPTISEAFSRSTIWIYIS